MVTVPPSIPQAIEAAFSKTRVQTCIVHLLRHSMNFASYKDCMPADRAFDVDWLRKSLSEHDISPVIPPRKNRKHPAQYDKEIYKWRRLIKNFFQKIKDYRGIAARYSKANTSYRTVVSLANTGISLK